MGGGGDPLKFCVLCQETEDTYPCLCAMFLSMGAGVGTVERKTWGCFVFLSKAWII